MIARQRKLLRQLKDLCKALGVTLDGTLTIDRKFIDRQKAHELVSTVLNGVLCDDPLNESRDQDLLNAEIALLELELIKKREYPDKNLW